MRANLMDAARRRPDVLSSTGELPLFVRNHAPRRALQSGRFLIMPQNAWPWCWSTSSPAEFPRQTALWAASELSMQRSLGVIRISGAIPTRGRTPPRVIHNVLDAAFEDLVDKQVARQTIARQFFFSAGSISGYRNLARLCAAHMAYRHGGGTIQLVIAGGGMPHLESRLRARIGNDPGIRYLGVQPRASILALLRNSHGVILPSLVEASPVGLLEAIALGPRVAASRIVGHTELIEQYAADVSSFDPYDVGEMANTLKWLDDSRQIPAPAGLSSVRARQAARESWSDDLVELIKTLTSSEDW